MNKRITAFIKLWISVLFVLTVLEPVKVLAEDTPIVRLNLIVSEMDQLEQCQLIDPIISSSEPLRWVAVGVPEDQLSERISYYQSCPIITEVYADTQSKLAMIPTDADYGTKQWNLEYMDLESAWDITTGSSEVIVAVIDTGVDTTSPLSDFAPGTVLKGVSILYNDYTAELEINEDTTVGEYSYDGGSHGTAVASVIAAAMNTKGITGIAPGVKILPVKVFDDETYSGEMVLAENTSIALGIVWAVDHGADIINLSLGSSYDDSTMKNAIQYAADHQVIVVASSGNNSDNDGSYIGYIFRDTVKYPAAYPSVIAVGSVNFGGRLSNFSDSAGQGIDVSSYGEGLWLPWVSDNRFENLDGTSFASPSVAGVLALLLSVYPDLTPLEAESILFAGAKDVSRLSGSYYEDGRDWASGYGIVNAFATLTNGRNYVNDKDTNQDPSTSVELNFDTTYTGEIYPVLDKDYYCYQSYQRELTEVTFTATGELQANLWFYSVDANGTQTRVGQMDAKYFVDHATWQINIPAGRTCLVITTNERYSYKTGGYSLMLSVVNPLLPTLTGTNSGGTLADSSISYEPVTIKYTGSFTPIFTATRNGNSIPFPANRVFTEAGDYVITLDDGHAEPSVYRFTISDFQLSGVVNGKSYNKDVTLTFNADTATINGETLTSGTTVSAEGTYHLVFTLDSVEYVVDFTIDKTGPTLYGLDLDHYIFSSPAVTFTEGTVTLNGLPFTSGSTITKEGDNYLYAVDALGNVTQKTIRIFTQIFESTKTASSGYDYVIFDWSYSLERVDYYLISQIDPVTQESTLIGTYPRSFETKLSGLQSNTKYIFSVVACVEADGKKLCSDPIIYNVSTTKLRAVYFEPQVIDYQTMYGKWSPIDKAEGYDVYINGVYIESITATEYTFRLPEPTSSVLSPVRINVVPFRMVDGVKETGQDRYYATKDYYPYLQNTKIQSLEMVGQTAYTLTWSPVVSATHYVVYYKDTYYWTGAKSVVVDGLSTTITDLNLSKKYDFKVVAYAKLSDTITLNSSDSSSVEGYTAPAVPTLQAFSYGISSIHLIAGSVPYANKYEFYELNQETQTYELIPNQSSAQVKLTGHRPGESYSFKVRAVNLKGAYSELSDAVTITFNPVTTNGWSIDAVYANMLVLSWFFDLPYTGYDLYYSKTIDGTYTYLGETTDSSRQVVVGLDFDTTYYFKFKPYLVLGDEKLYGAFSSVLTAKTGLSKIEEILAESAGYNSNKIMWSPVPGATGYEVYAYIGSSYVLKYISSVTATTFTHTGLVTNTEYKYTIKPYRLVGSTRVYGPTSYIASATPVPSAPEVTVSVLTPTSIKISWPIVAGATGYEVSYAAYGTMGSGYTVKPLTTLTSMTLTGLPAGHEFVFVVRAYRLVGTQKIFGDLGFNFCLTATANPTLTATSVNPTSLKLSWNAVPYAEGYELIYFNPETRLFEVLSDSSALTYTQTGLKTGERHLYMVRSYIMNELGHVYSLKAQYVTAAAAPSAVTGTKVDDPKTTQLTLSWNASPEATGYEITRSTSATGTFTFVANVEDGLNYTNSGLVFNTTYYYKVRPYTTVDGVKTYGLASAPVSGKTALDTVLNPSAVFTSYNTNLISWSPVTGVTTYEIYYSVGSSTTYTLLKAVTGTSYSHTGLLTNTTYNYKIRATKTVSLVKYVGTFSSVVSSVPLPTAPIVSAVSTGTDSIQATWPSVAGATGYEVITSLNPDFESSTTITVSTNVFNQNGLVTDVPVYLKVRAYRLVGAVKVYSAFSSTVSAKPVPNTPNLSGSVIDYQSVRLTWNAILNASGYELYKKNEATGEFDLIQDNTELSFSENELVTGSINQYKIKAYVLVNDVRIYSLESSVVSLKPVPSPVGNFQLVSSKYNSLSLSWNGVTGATGYEISRSTSATGTFTVVALVTDGTAFNDLALAFNTTYVYKIRAYTTVDEVNVYGSSSNVLTGKTALETVLEPKAAYTSYNSNAISWNAVAGAAGYEIHRSTGTSTTYTLLASVTATTYNNTLLLTNTKYNYKIRAYRMVGTVRVYGAFSSVVSSTPLPWAPTASVISTGYNTLKVTWPAVAGANGYEVSYSTAENGVYTKLALLTTTSTTIPNLLTNTTYYVKVRAYRTVNYVKIYGASSVIVTGTPIPATPVVTAISVNHDSVKLSWVAIAGANGYEVYAKSLESSEYFLVEETPALTSTVVRLMTGTPYQFIVKAYRLVNGVKVYSTDSIVKSATPIPASVNGFKVAMPSITSLKLSWTAVSGATGYEIFKSTTLAGSYVSVGLVEGNTEFTVTGLTFNTSTYYKVRAYTTVGETKIYGLISTALTAKTMPSTVQLVVTNVAYNTNTLSWPTIEGASGYEIYVSTGTSTYYTLLKSLTATTFTHPALAFNTQYNYKVRAYRLVGTVKVYGAYSTVMSVKTAVSAPSAIVGLTHDSINLTWGAVAGASGYEVAIATSLTGPYTVSLQTSVSKTFSGLSTGTTYYIKLRSYRLVSTTKVFGPYSDVLVVTPKLDVPTLQISLMTGSSVTFTWSAVSGASDYEVRIRNQAEGSEWIVESVDALTVTFSDLDPAINYIAQIRAVKKINEIPVGSAFSEELYFTPVETA